MKRQPDDPFRDPAEITRDELIEMTADALDTFAGILDDVAEGRGFINVATAKNKIANLREHILNRSDLEEETVYVPGWDCDVLVRALSGAERAKFQKAILAQTPGVQPGQTVSIDWGKFWADIVILTARDPEDGALIFSPTDRDMLLTKAAKNLEVVAAVARRLSGLDDNALANAKSTSTDE